MAAAQIVGGMLERNNSSNDGYYVDRALHVAMMLADRIEETDEMPDLNEARKVIMEIFDEYGCKTLNKSRLAMAIQTKMKTGKRNVENIILWAETNGVLNLEISGNRFDYSLV